MSEYKETYLACNLSALSTNERETHRELLPQLGSQLQKFRELDQGYAFQFPATALETIVQFLPLERKCCPFLEFLLEIGGNDGPIWLTITGPAGVKEFIQMDLKLGLTSSMKLDQSGLSFR
jgi:hypothetical protein